MLVRVKGNPAHPIVARQKFFILKRARIKSQNA